MTLTAALTATPPVADEQRTTRILLVDGHCLFRHALRALLCAEREFLVVGEAGRAAEAIELIEELRPDVVVTDLHLADGGGTEFITRVRDRFPAVALLVLTAMRARGAAAAARRAGAGGYLHKHQRREELSAALREVAAGRWYRSEKALPVADRGRRVARGSPEQLAACLTEHQRQVLRSIALGHTTREIALVLGVSENAVLRRRERLRTLLQLDSTAALTRYAAREGLVE